MSKYQPYPEYKDSEVEWLGNVPEHWEKTRLKFLGFTYGGLSGKAGKDFNQEDNKLSKPFIPFTNIAGSNYIKDDYFGLVIINEGETQNKVKKNDLFFLMSSEDYEDLGKASLLQFDVEELYLNSFCKGFRLTSKNINPKYLNFLLAGDTYRKLLYTQGNGFTRINLRLERLNDLVLSLAPTLEEQTTIANFLDCETAKIDTLIEKQQELIELLKEKRQAVISTAVTRGLDSTVAMKDSGVEWVGEIPEHWAVYRIGNLFTEAVEYGKTNLPILRVSIHDGVSDREYSSKEMDRKVARSEDRSKYKCVQPDDLVYNMMRAWQGGFGAVKVNGLVSPAYVVARPIKPMSTSYIELLLRTAPATEEMRRYSRGITDFRLRLYWDEFKNMKVVFPRQEEMDGILKHIESENNKIDTLVEKAYKGIALLKERRTALISAAVTGKIDVREK